MKQIMTIAIALCVLGLASAAPLAQEVPSDPGQPEPGEPGEPGRTCEPDGEADELGGLVWCGVYIGQPCTAGQTRRCEFQPLEPAFCWCPNGVYECS